MKKDAIFINTTRGDTVNQDDLYDALNNNVILAAGIDVCAPEPIPKDHKLLTLNNLTIFPHIGSSTEECRFNMAKLSVINLINGVQNKKLHSSIY